MSSINLGKNRFLLALGRSVTKIAGSGSESVPKTKLSRISNTAEIWGSIEHHDRPENAVKCLIINLSILSRYLYALRAPLSNLLYYTLRILSVCAFYVFKGIDQ